MKFFGLIRANLFRKKIRFILTIGSFAVALFLFGVLAVVRVAFSGGIDIAGRGPSGRHQSHFHHPAAATGVCGQNQENPWRKGTYVCQLVRRRLSGRTKFLSPIRDGRG